MDPTQTLADLSAQTEWYMKLLRLAEVQHALIAQERTDDLLVVLERRQMIVDALTALEVRLRPVKLGWHELAPTIAADDRAQIEARFAENRRLLGRITQADQDDALVLTQRKITVGQQLRATGAGQQVNRRYAAGAYAGVGSRMDVSR